MMSDKKVHGNTGKPGHGKNSPVIGMNGYNLEKGDNAIATQFVMDLYELEKDLDYNDVEAVNKRINDYFQLCVKHDTKPLVSGLATALCMDRRRLYEVTHDIRAGHKYVDDMDSRSRDLIKKAYRKMEVLWEHYMLNGKLNPITGIFLSKNHFGYADKQEVIVTPNNPLGDYADPKQLNDYIEATVVDD